MDLCSCFAGSQDQSRCADDNRYGSCKKNDVLDRKTAVKQLLFVDDELLFVIK
jgi:hypothetical protein